MICKLCLKEKKLIKAHIIPRWAFAYLYPTGKIGGPPLVVVGKERDKKSPIGLYDSNLLCSDCDSFLGNYDDYGKEVLLDSVIEPYETPEIASIIKPVDTEKFRIFLLSVIWRCSISSKDEMVNINLGIHEPIIREALQKLQINNSLSVIKNYNVVIMQFKTGILKDIADKYMQLPYTQKINGINYIVLYFPRSFKILIKMDTLSALPEFKNIELAGDEMFILKHNFFEKSPEFAHIMRYVHGKKY